MGIPGPVPASPYVMEFGDYVGKVIRITVHFDLTTRALTGITVYRDAECLFTRILIGLGPDGTPDTTARAFEVAPGTTVLTSAQMNAVRNNGMATIEEFTNAQITAGRPEFKPQ